MLATDPVNYDCLIGMAKLKYIKGDLEGAREHFDRALVVRPEREKTMYQLGRVLYDLKVYDRSKLLFEQVADSAAGVDNVWVRERERERRERARERESERERERDRQTERERERERERQRQRQREGGRERGREGGRERFRQGMGWQARVRSGATASQGGAAAMAEQGWSATRCGRRQIRGEGGGE